MAARFFFVLVAAVLIFQMTIWLTSATAIRRDTAAVQKNATQILDEALQNFKTGVEDLVKKVQSNELVQNVSQSLRNFGEQVQTRGEQLIADIQKSTSKTSN